MSSPEESWGALVVADAVGKIMPRRAVRGGLFYRGEHAAVCWNIRSTPARRCGMGWRCRRCCRADTMPTSFKWRREQSILETAKKRPDLLWRAIEEGKLDKKELAFARQLLEEEDE